MVKTWLFHTNCSNKAGAGYLAYWAFLIHPTAVVHHWIQEHLSHIWHMLMAGPWPLPRPPMQAFATDASDKWIAVDDRLGPLFVHLVPQGHI